MIVGYRAVVEIDGRKIEVDCWRYLLSKSLSILARYLANSQFIPSMAYVEIGANFTDRICTEDFMSISNEQYPGILFDRHLAKTSYI